MEVPVEMHLRYLQHRRRDLDACKQWLAAHDYSKLEKIGHKMKGSGATFGHPSLTQIGRKLERGANQRDQFQIKEALRELSGWLNEQLS